MKKNSSIFSEITGNPSTVAFIVVTFAIAFMLAIHQYEIQTLKQHIIILKQSGDNTPAAVKSLRYDPPFR